MKLRNLFYLLLALPLVFVACEEDKPVDEVKDPVLTLTSASTLEFTAAAATGEISYKLENPIEGQNVAAEADVDWITDVTVGEKVTFAVAANDSTEAREGKVTVSYTTLSFEVAVKQAGKTLEPELAIVAGEAAEFEAEGGNGAIEYEVKNAVEGTELVATCEAEWIEVAVVAAESKVTYTVAANTKAESRSAKVVLTYGELKAEATVSQKPFVEEGKPALSLKSEAAIKFTAEGGNGTIKYELVNPQEEVELEATCEAQWVSAIAVDEAKSEVTFAVAANEAYEARNAQVKVAYGELSFEVSVEQEAAEEPEPTPEPELTLKGEATKEFAAEGGNGEFAYELKNAVEGTELVATCEAQWVSNVAVDEANSKVTYTVATNESEEAREAEVVLAYGELEVKVAVKQAAAEASSEPSFTLKSLSSVTAQAAGGQAVIGYNLENPVEGVNVEASVDVEWISITEIDQDKKRIYYYVNETDTRDERTGIITATYGEYGSFTVTVNQKGGTPTLTVMNNAIEEIEYEVATMNITYKVKFPTEGVDVVTTVEYISPEGVSNWVTDIENVVVPAEGDAANEDAISGYVSFNVTANEAKGNRVAKIILTYGSQVWAMELTQKDNMPDDVYMNVVEVFATMTDGGKNWTLTFEEYDPVLGPARTELVVTLKEKNVRYLTSGTYTAYKKGVGFRSGTAATATTERSGSVYRYNVIGAEADITGDDRELTIDVNEGAQTVKINAHFISKQKNAENEKWNDVNVIINWEGNVKGFTYADPSEEITEWKSFSIVKSDNSQANHTWNRIEGTAKNGTTVVFDLYSPSGDTYVLPAGEYEVCHFTNNKSKSFICDTGDPTFAFASKVNGYGLKSGSIIVEDVDGGKKFTYNLVDINDINVKGTYTGVL